ncbi:cell division protein ZapA [Halarsenatibacter silvermanii]|uniref:Cell division protein ZapA n=1 Tax=Halarsenatibacter silvermanii TaxID=321763 RepID=A0A1G9K3G6_9FIRM|nr:cell division protein ZapA [Halarsenatibacter silvermanii]SDL43885.1 cell division protein ZapA [Halarsenatibacter silvermanii]
MNNNESYNRKKYEVEILGETMPVTGELSLDYLNKLVEEVNGVGEEISAAYPTLPRRRLYGLTMLNLADKYFKSEQNRKKAEEKLTELEEENKELEQEMKRLREENEELLNLLQEVE